jgi:twitching motility two-component system response regulator PilH
MKMAIKKILIVDDSPTERHFLGELLTKHGFQIMTLESGEEAIAKAADLMPDLILMDVVMPGMNGFQATRTITKDERTKHIPVIMCTSKNQETDMVWARRQGATEYVVKPVDPQDLLSKIAAL